MSIERLEELLASRSVGALSPQECDELVRLIDSDPALEAAAGWDLLIDRVLPHTGLRAEAAAPVRPQRGWPLVASLAAALAMAVGVVWWVVATRPPPPAPPSVPVWPAGAVPFWSILFEQDGRVRAFGDPGGAVVDRPDRQVLREGRLSPDGKRVLTVTAEDGDAEIWVADRDGANPRKLTDNDAIDNIPSWSPDGRRVAFGSTRGGTWQVWVMEADGGGARQLTAEAEGARDPQWSPSGAWIAYVPRYPKLEDRIVPHGNGISLVRPDGRESRSVVAGPMNGDYAWDPEGARIAYNRDNRLWVYDVAADRAEAVTRFGDITPALAGHHARNICWRPDGQAVACNLVFEGQTVGDFEIHGRKQIYVFPLGGVARELTLGSAPRVLGWETEGTYVRSATVNYVWEVPPGEPFVINDTYELWKLASFFPEMGKGLQGGPPAGWEAMASVRFETLKGPVTVLVPVNPIDVWSEGKGDWPADPSLKPFLRSLAVKYAHEEPLPLASKDLSGTWRGENNGMKITVYFFEPDDVRWRVDINNEKGNVGIEADLKLVDQKPGSVQIRFDSSALLTGTVVGHLERGEGESLRLTILPVATRFSQYVPVEGFPLSKVNEDAAMKRFRAAWVDANKLHGNWTATAGGAYKGKEEPEEEIKRAGHRLVISGGDRLSWHTALATEPMLKGTFKLDPSKNPKELDLLFTRGGAQVVGKCIYELNGNTLRLCYDEGERPAEFKTRADAANLKLYVFTRDR